MTPEELLTTTRTVRKRLDLTRPVPAELVERALTIALQAPTGSNSQGWHWIVVTDAGQKASLAELYRRSYRAYREHGQSPEERYPGDAERVAVQHRVRSSSDHLAEHMQDVPVLVVPAITVPGGELAAGNQAGLWGSILPAVWNYMLAARLFGLGTAYTTLHLAFEKEAAEVLGLPDDIRQAALIPTAYYTGSTFKPAPRQPLAEVLHHDRW
ncbi:nitroreductase [Amycolatopsis bartoniae]|uniref:Oxidoreductase n=1 Tax=Amycolatopsis bartoniae TaxID=941986 RepID=A0A8H9INZ2_9PSEU|nr:nitroreductase family protein [Amycolatopsis bartoniae]MBB2938145.1 nitroreductase [Amycolatopsis bartoniae]TVT03248.1 nitroreductase family protein [Amycolatopsis bartoniae]GHF32989.1 oxidoreductase [Amycolatopsis bartoniae]